MNEFKINSENKEKELEDQLKKLPKEKRKIWRLIAVGIIMPFIGPYIPMRKGMLVDRMGYQDSVLMFFAIFLIAIPAGCYMHFQKINNEIFDIECQLENLKQQNKQKIEREIVE
ncbi:hypothetical protein SAMN05444671_3190 [Flavobacterium sp. CF108]|jgi:hypothetical protein|uniref:hypothetical protein n=1 Tax=unclassified Flavobacterium TaxID=196869 RepID=UPI0008B93F97|nr:MULTISPECIES: hypothetical protein [unclassified Flavobacterium]SEP28504.1 hypothetical protein SAMN04487978_0366 [Flavobacterium sp. fv08]SHH56718.1 hypothetical protein SAMN05444671_3190 [Flavobacterium sp. CF108]